MPQHTPVTVNFNVSIDASGNISIFGAQQDSVTNVIVAEYKLPVDCLYNSDVSGGLIEFWEPSDALGTIKCKLADGVDAGHDYTDFYKLTAKKLAKGLQRALCDSFDCSGASPYAGNSSYANSAYYNVSNFSRVALNLYAHYLFGHVAATSAITNDVSFMANMLSVTESTASDASGNALSRYNDWTEASNISSWDCVTTSTTTADLARKLVSTLIKKGIDANGNLVISDVSTSSSGPSAPLAQIVKQVLGQDASRAMDQDNNELTPNTHQLLRFYDGDVIYVSITLKQPLVTVNGQTGFHAGGQQAYTDSSSIAGNTYTETTYTIKLTLDGNKSADNIGLNVDLQSAPSYFYGLDAATINSLLSAINSLTSNTDTSAINGVFNLVNTKASYDAIKGGLIDAIFAKLGTSTFNVTSSVLNPSLSGATSVPSTVVVYQPTSTPLDVSTLDANNGLYVNLYEVGSSTYFTYNSNQIVITKTSETLYTVTDNSTSPATISTHIKGDIITIGNIGYMFGSVMAFNSKFSVKYLKNHDNYEFWSTVVDSTGKVRACGIIKEPFVDGSGNTVNLSRGLLYFSELEEPIIFREDISAVPSSDTSLVSYYTNKGIGTSINELTIDASDNVYVGVNIGGNTNIYDASGNLFVYKNKLSVFKYNSSGEQLFRKDFSNYTTCLNIRTIAVDENQNIFLGGIANDDLFVPANTFNIPKSTPNISGGYVVKCDSLCNPIWGRWYNVKSSLLSTVTITQNLNDIIQSIYVKEDRVLITGYTRYSIEQIEQNKYPIPAGHYGIFLIKLDSNGTQEFGKWIEGYSHDLSTKVIEDGSGNIFVAGNAVATVYVSNNTNTQYIEIPGKIQPGWQGVVVKFSSIGHYISAKYIENINGVSQIMNMTIDVSNNIYITGYGHGTFASPISLVVDNNSYKQSGSWNKSNQYLMRLDNNLTPTWGHWIDIPSNNTTFALFGLYYRDNSIYVSGSTVDNIDSIVISDNTNAITYTSRKGFILKYTP